MNDHEHRKKFPSSSIVVYLRLSTSVAAPQRRVHPWFLQVQVTDLGLPATSTELQPRELLHQRPAVRITVAVRQIAAIRAGENGGQFLQREQLRVEGVDKRIHRFLEVAQLNV